jgi:putative ABC transport system permease protein
MIRHVLRRLARRKGISLITIGGLALGLGGCLLMTMYVLNETRYEDLHVNRDRIVRVALEWGREGSRMKFAGTMAGLGPAMAAELPGVESAVRVITGEEQELRSAPGADPVTVERLCYADSDFFVLFSYPWAAGDRAAALRDPGSVVISVSLARALFGTPEALGRTVVYQDHPFTVSGVMGDPPLNTHLRPELVLPYDAREALTGRADLPWSNWGSVRTYALLRGRPDLPRLGADLRVLLERNVEPAIAGMLNFHVQPLNRLHWISDFRGDNDPRGSRSYFFMFITAAVLVLLTACFNYINLTSAQYLERRREIGVRGTLGATRGRITAQLLKESLVVSAIAMSLGIAVYQVAYKPMMAYIGAAVVLSPAHTAAAAGIFVLVFAAAMAAGAVPAWSIARRPPVEVLGRGVSRGPSPRRTVRTVLFALQFVITIVLLVSTLVVGRQLSYAMDSDLGFEKDDVLLVSAGSDVGARYETVRQELGRIPAVRSVSAAFTAPGIRSMANMAVFTDSTDLASATTMQALAVDYDYPDALGLRLAVGRGFSREAGTDAAEALVINETAVRVLGLNEPVGAVLKVPRGENDIRSMRVIGVVRDFHVQSLHHAINPMIMFIAPDRASTLVVRCRPGQAAAAQAAIRETLQRIMPGTPAGIRFMDAEWARDYRSETRTAGLLKAFSLLAVGISCAGLLGLTSFAIGRRVREIGIRRVLGASTPAIVWLLSREYLLMVLAANAIAWPLAWYAMRLWLRNFAYRITPGAELFVLAGGLAFLIALATSGLRTTRAAQARPADSLRVE